MACPEIVQMRNEVLGVMRGNVNTWQYQLQSKWGDPRVYELEQAERARQDARLAHDASRRTSMLLQNAYEQQAQKNREAHTERFKRRDYRKSGKSP